MNLEHLLTLGHQVLSAPNAREGARALVREVPVKTLLGLGLGRISALSIGAPIAGAFALGAVAGAGAILFFAPGSAEMRKAIVTRVGAARDRLRREDPEQAAAARVKAAAFATATHDEHGHAHDHDEHGHPRRRSNPRA